MGLHGTPTSFVSMSSAMVRSFSANTSVLMTFACCCTDAHAGQTQGEAEAQITQRIQGDRLSAMCVFEESASDAREKHHAGRVPNPTPLQCPGASVQPS